MLQENNSRRYMTEMEENVSIANKRLRPGSLQQTQEDSTILDPDGLEASTQRQISSYAVGTATHAKGNWTPGPWRVYELRMGEGRQIRDERDAVVASLHGGIKTQAANARLIAACPDLLEACRAAIRYDESICGAAIRGEVDMLANGAGITVDTNLDELYFDWQTKARAALAKAEKEK